MKRVMILSNIVLIASIIFTFPVFSQANNEEAISHIREQKVVYRRMAATYAELSLVYATSNYKDADFVGWETVPDPQNPVATLVTMKFSISGVNPDVLGSDVTQYETKKLEGAAPLLRITWHVNALLNPIKIKPYNFYAQDALKIYKGMVDIINKLAE